MDLPSKGSIIFLARIGYLAKGFIFTSMGLLSALAAFQGGRGASDSRGAIRAIVQQPFGRVLLLAVIAGLVSYVCWRIVAAIGDLEKKGSDAKGLALRARMLFAAGIYSGVTAAAVKTLMGASSRGGGDKMARDWTERAMAAPFGSWLVALIGAGFVVGGLYQCFRAYRGAFEKKLELSAVGARARRWLLRVCAFGLSARGLVFCIAGLFLVQAGLHSDPSQARGLGGALNSLQAQLYGRFLFGIVAAGLAAYGIYCAVRARSAHFGERQSELKQTPGPI